ncbi:MAG: DMT family transporter [Ktedonobacterales bacterium]
MATTIRERAAAVATTFNSNVDTSRRIAFLTLVLANALWAGTYTAGKVALDRLSPVELNALRFTLASLMLSPVLIRGWRQISLDRRSLFSLARLVLLGFVLNKIFEYVGLALSTASDVALLIATESLFTAMLSWTLLRERVSRLGVAALLVGLAGAYLIVARGFVPQLAPGHSDTRILGDVLVVLSLLIEAGYSVLGKSAVTTVPPLLFTAVSITGSLFVWIPAGLISVAHSSWPHMTPNTWLAVLYMAAIATVTGYWLWFRGLRVLDGSIAAPTLFIQPLLGSALAIWLLHDTVTWATLLGGVLIGVSLLLVMRGTRRSPSEPSQPAHPPVVVEEPTP